MAQPTVTDSQEAFIKLLRAQTAASHNALEAHPFSKSITDPGISLPEYIRYLQLMQQVVVGMESLLDPLLGEIIPDVELRRKACWLSGDLQHFGGVTNPFPAFRLSCVNRSIPSALGSYYVLEGSTLGGRVILRNIVPALGLSRNKGARYFDGYGPATGVMWQQFMQIISEYSISHDIQNEVITAATQAFQDILDYFNACLEK